MDPNRDAQDVGRIRSSARGPNRHGRASRFALWHARGKAAPSPAATRGVPEHHAPWEFFALWFSFIAGAMKTTSLKTHFRFEFLIIDGESHIYTERGQMYAFTWADAMRLTATEIERLSANGYLVTQVKVWQWDPKG